MISCEPKEKATHWHITVDVLMTYNHRVIMFEHREFSRTSLDAVEKKIIK